MIEMCIEHKLNIMSTRFYKSKKKLATYRKIGTNATESITRKTHEQIDYVLTEQKTKWKILDCETDTKTYLDSDHYPLIIKCLNTLVKNERYVFQTRHECCDLHFLKLSQLFI